MAVLTDQLVQNRGDTERYLDNGRDFIDDDLIHRTLEQQRSPDKKQVMDILAKSRSIETLSLEETAVLLQVTDGDVLQEMVRAGQDIKKNVYDNRIVTFAPFYTGNRCVNNCLYCGFRKENRAIERQVLSLDEVRAEVKVLAGTLGHKRLIAVYGEHPTSDARYIADTLNTIYSVKVPTAHGYGNIRRVNVNAAPMSVSDLRLLHGAGIGTYQVFQETYHHGSYAKLHDPGTIKGDYQWRLYAMHRAFEAGIDDVGIGVLFGLYDWKFEVLGLVRHALELEKVFGIGPHTVSFPRLEPAFNTPYVDIAKHKVRDAEFLRLITVLRLAIPYTGMILTARESAVLRDTALPLGCTQTDASSRIGIGAYSRVDSAQLPDTQQFVLGDTRSLDELIRDLARGGTIVSFCTAGYRCGRTGQNIMQLLKSGREGQFCKLNAILTYKEWLEDFASAETKQAGERVIQCEMAAVETTLPQFYPMLKNKYERIAAGERDLFF